ncbi:site-specific DNA-methyltransferase [Helicobacter sp. 11S03491-1]|uniref:DNA-methyltransferase n=1 Tax=Helicobacter sp. 11S03491-1 TaxID=1476196 RepID=UPI000BA60DB4|nr:site-specific DNA-methyltransferase [Helicobacter sp. 11S03491-1]PAF43043.1 site-specific DNA-methyltransferase [Helicobacter sp. 11S03491-1]
MQTYYEKKDLKLFLGDCIETLEKITPETIDMIFVDPPYHLSNNGFTCQAGKAVCVNKGDWDKSSGVQKDFDFHQKWIACCKRVLKPSGTIWVCGTYHSIYSCGFALQKSNFKILNDICWFKPNASPNLSCRYFTASHETLLWAKKDSKSKHIFNYETMKNGEWDHDKIKQPNKQMRSVWAINTPKMSEKTFGKHPTQKPLELLRRIILASTNKADLILDPFTGSSTTGIAALELGRKFIGIDAEKQYLDLSIKRFEQAFSKKDKLW